MVKGFYIPLCLNPVILHFLNLQRTPKLPSDLKRDCSCLIMVIYLFQELKFSLILSNYYNIRNY
uniref:Uncharacterized protein n=1 Tax=Lepeophtheirus salmonis TaxID=72036 RepID=A0A0K2T4L1_LEPSM